MRDTLLVETCDWKELAKIDARIPIATLAGLPTGPGRVARVIAFRHLAGDRAACDAAVAATIEAVKAKKLDPQLLIRPLVLSDHVDACVELMSPVAPATAFDLLIAQNRLRDAFRLAKVDPSAVGKTDWAAWLKDGGKRVTPQRSGAGYERRQGAPRGWRRRPGAGIVYGCM